VVSGCPLTRAGAQLTHRSKVRRMVCIVLRRTLRSDGARCSPLQ
jgi:hypothetical protein